jgi:neutral ceramidase
MQVGIATTAITPDRPIWMTGFASRTAPSEGAYNDLEASAIVLDNGAARLGIMALDLVGIDEFLLEPIRERAAELDIPAEHMLVNCSHTHCAPACRRARGSCRNFDDGYLGDLIETLGGLLGQAVGDLQEARLDHTVGCCTLGINRRRRRPDGRSAGMLPAPDKPTDTDVPVLRVLSPDGDVRSVILSYACHPTTMGGQLVGTDYPGPARDFLREKLPGCTPIFLQGCGGDVKPRNVTAERTFASGPLEVVYEIGHELGRAAMAALCGEPTALGSELAGASVIADLPTRGDPSEEKLAALEAGNQWERKWAEAARETIAEKGHLAKALPVEVQVLSIGDLYLVGMGGEISCEIGLELKERLSDISLWTLGYSNLLRCYVASLEAHSEGGYEVEQSFIYSWTPEPRPLGLKPESVAVLIDAATELVRSV